MAKATTKTVTLGEAVEAIIENGLPKYKGWERREGGKLVAACSIAQGARNLGVTWSSLASALEKVYVFDGGPYEVTAKRFIMNLNDTTEKPVDEIGREAARRLKALSLMPLTNLTVAS